jgi:hypothetical protein
MRPVLNHSSDCRGSRAGCNDFVSQAARMPLQVHVKQCAIRLCEISVPHSKLIGSTCPTISDWAGAEASRALQESDAGTRAHSESCRETELAFPIGVLINVHETVLKNGIFRMILPGANQAEGGEDAEVSL